MYYQKTKWLISYIYLCFILLSCNLKDKNTVKNNETMNAKKANPCNVRDKELTLLYVEKNLNEIAKDEFCMDFVIEHLIKNFEKDKKAIILLLEGIDEVYSSEAKWYYSKDLVKKYPLSLLNYFNDNPQSGIRKNTITSFNINTEFGEEIEEAKKFFRDIRINNKLEDAQVKSLEAMYDEIIFSYRGFLIDEEGYVNLRKTPNGEIIFKLDSGIDIYVTPTKEDWWKIKTVKSEARGYIHKSRIKLLDEVLNF